MFQLKLEQKIKCEVFKQIQGIISLTKGVQGRRQRGAGGRLSPNIPVGGASLPLPNKIGAMMTECVLLLLHALDAFRNALLLYTRSLGSRPSPRAFT